MDDDNDENAEMVDTRQGGNKNNKSYESDEEGDDEGQIVEEKLLMKVVRMIMIMNLSRQ